MFQGKNLTCVRGERIVFQDLNFDLAEGGALVLIGPNGAGKSSLLRLMAGLLAPAEGSLLWKGENTLDDFDEHALRLHYVGHHDAVKPVLTGLENVRFWSGVRGGKIDDEHILGALDAFDAGRLADVAGRFLSAGQKRRVNLARIIAAPAPLWLLDEPTTALDRASIALLDTAIRKHRESGGAVVLSTHADINLDAATVMDLSDFAATYPLGYPFAGAA